ncbi:hypothetical protein [Microbispora sp. H10836]|uniref:hypothetical protein n=1 Tax=Microbispora sp. H10836 TaxID=2729106 RepID=UPI001474DCF0|nr:hypothetical protein [Microbispora sp. H10836]
MGPFEQIAIDYLIDATRTLDEAASHFASTWETGECVTAEELSRAAVAQHLRDWWQQVMNQIDADEAVDTVTAIMESRRAAEAYLISASQLSYGELFTQAMAQARRQAARQFLDSTRHLAEALTGPTSAGRSAPATGPAGGERRA